MAKKEQQTASTAKIEYQTCHRHQWSVL